MIGIHCQQTLELLSLCIQGIQIFYDSLLFGLSLISHCKVIRKLSVAILKPVVICMISLYKSDMPWRAERHQSVANSAASPNQQS